MRHKFFGIGLEGLIIWKKFLLYFILATIAIFAALVCLIIFRQVEVTPKAYVALVIAEGLWGITAVLISAFVSSKAFRMLKEAYREMAFEVYKIIWKERTGNFGTWGVVVATCLAYGSLRVMEAIFPLP